MSYYHKIKDAVTNNKANTSKELMKLFGISNRTVCNNLKKLQDDGIIVKYNETFDSRKTFYKKRGEPYDRF